MRARVSLEIIVKVWMSIEMQDVHRSVGRCHRFQHWKADRMIAAEDQRHSAVSDRLGDCLGDQRSVALFLSQGKIVPILDGYIDADLRTGLRG
jgi:hypothetical protein